MWFLLYLLFPTVIVALSCWFVFRSVALNAMHGRGMPFVAMLINLAVNVELVWLIYFPVLGRMGAIHNLKTDETGFYLSSMMVGLALVPLLTIAVWGVLAYLEERK